MTGWTPIARGREGSYQTLRDAPMSLHEARAAYDAGTHEMATRRLQDGAYEIVVAERRIPVPRQPWFAPRAAYEDRRHPAPWSHNARSVLR